MTGPLASEFDRAVANLTSDTFKVLGKFGIDLPAILRAGHVGVEKVATTGRTYVPDAGGFGAVILGCWRPRPPSIYWAGDAELIDLLAIRPSEPEHWWHRVGAHDIVLGQHLLEGALEYGCPVQPFRSPVEWLQGNCRGYCDLGAMRDQSEAERLRRRDAAARTWWEAA